MYNPFSAFCDDFYVNMRLSTQLNLPHSRETVLHFFERLQKEFPALIRFRKHENGDLCLEENRDSESYRWATLESRRLLAGHVNPPSIEEAMKIHTLLLQLAPFDLGISPLEVDYLDVLFGFDLSFRGNHDEVVAESLLQQSPLTSLLEESGAKAVDIQPTVTVALSEDCRLQARIDIITRTNSYQVRTGDYNNDVISVYLVLRRYCGDRPREPMEQLFAGLVEKRKPFAIAISCPKCCGRCLRRSLHGAETHGFKLGVHGWRRSAKIAGVNSPPQHPSDAAALLGEARQRTEKLLGDLHREKSEWQSAPEGSAIAEQGKAAVSHVIAALQRLAMVIDADCSVGQGGVNQIDKSSPHDE